MTKEDSQVAHSPRHGPVQTLPRTAAATRARREGSRRRRCPFLAEGLPGEEFPDQETKPKEVRLQKADVGKIVIEEGIKTFQQLLEEAQRRKLRRDETLSTFVLNRGRKLSEETVELANLMAESLNEAQLTQRKRVDVLAGPLS